MEGLVARADGWGSEHGEQWSGVRRYNELGR